MVQLTLNKNKKITETVFKDKKDSNNPKSQINQRIKQDRLSKFKDIDELEENADFIKEIEEALELHDQGKYKRMNADAFLKEIKKW